METGFFIFMLIIFVLAAVLILSFIGPEDRKTGFWAMIRKIRAGMDAVGYWFFNACAAGTIILVIVYASVHLIGCGQTKDPSEQAASSTATTEHAAEQETSPTVATEQAAEQVASTTAATEQDAEQAASTTAATEQTAEKEVSSTITSEFESEQTVSPTESPKSESFYITEITDDIWERIKGKSFKDDCTLPREDLRYLHVLHVDIDGVEHEGEMICNVHIAETVLDILKQLYEAGYPIEKIRLIDEYDADDETSMRDNNSSCFNFRFISHTTKVSKHGLGLAVDINTLYNPYIKYVNGERVLEPATAEPYLDRDADFPYKIEKGDLCYQLFTENGFEWGGNWSDRKDYQHFELPTDEVEKLYP